MPCFAMGQNPAPSSYLWRGTGLEQTYTATKSITCLTQVLVKEAIIRSSSRQQSYSSGFVLPYYMHALIPATTKENT